MDTRRSPFSPFSPLSGSVPWLEPLKALKDDRVGLRLGRALSGSMGRGRAKGRVSEGGGRPRGGLVREGVGQGQGMGENGESW